MYENHNFSPIFFITGSIILYIVLLFFLSILTHYHIKRIKTNEKHKRAMQQQHHDEIVKNSILIQESERKKIAANIHDDLISRLRHIQLLSNEEHCISKLKDCIALARNISHELSPPLIKETSLVELFRHFISPFKKKYHITFLYSEETNSNISLESKLNIYRIYQEIISNIEKHAYCNSIEIYVRVSQRNFCLIIKDDGIGLKKNKIDGLGMKNIAIRAEQLAACYKFCSNKPNGTKFIFVCKV